MKPSHIQRRHIAAEASEWFVTMRDEAPAPAARQAFAEWLLRSPAHIEEYLAVSRVWGDVGQDESSDRAALLQMARECTDADKVVALDARKPLDVQHTSNRLNSSAVRRLAAAIAVLGVAASLLWSVVSRTVPDVEQISTAIGEQRSLTLPDGSIVHINSLSAIRMEFSEGRRGVVLEFGEARFQVRADPTRPFTVRTPQASVMVLGTVFNVRASQDRTAVTVVEGHVAVRSDSLNSNAKRDSAVLELRTGQVAEVRRDGAVRAGEGPSVEAALAWTERRIVFRDERLGSVIEEFNRYRSERIELRGEVLANERVSGSFDASDAESFIAYLEVHEGVRRRIGADGVLIIER